MTLPPRSSRLSGAEASLDAILDARERRAGERQALLLVGRGPLVAISAVMPGVVKTCPLSCAIHAAAIVAFEETLRSNDWPAEKFRTGTPVTGPEALFAVAADPESLKRACVDLETRHPLGRLWDIDVVASTGTVSRKDVGLPARRCILCDQPAHACARSRAHDVGELLAAIEAAFDAWSASRLP